MYRTLHAIIQTKRTEERDLVEMGKLRSTLPATFDKSWSMGDMETLN